MFICFLNTYITHSSMLPSLHHLCLDFPRSDSRVCRGGFPSHCDGEVRFLGLVFCEEELAVCHLWHWRLHQLYDHHVSQRGGCLDKHHLARLHILSNKCFMKHLFRALFQELSHPQPERLLVFSLLRFLFASLSHGHSPPQPFPCWCLWCYFHLARCMKRWPICWQT